MPTGRVEQIYRPHGSHDVERDRKRSGIRYLFISMSPVAYFLR
jgi:hypothetical protein